MARELHACLIRYFARLERLDDRWRELSGRAERPLEVLANRAEQLRHVTNEEVDRAEESVDRETRERLTFKILMGLEEEIALLSNILTQLNDANQDLRNHLVNLENARSRVSLKDETMGELIEGTPYRPTLERLLQWAVEGFQFFHNMYLRINDCMKSIDYKAEGTIENLVCCFAEEKRGRKKINRILAFTQFLAKESLH